jgi:inhibitor of KinA
MLQRRAGGAHEGESRAVTACDRSRISPLGDCALVVALGDDVNEDTNLRVRSFSDRLAAARPPAVIEHIPAFTNVTVLYDPLRSSYGALLDVIKPLIGQVPDVVSDMGARTVEIPVCYGEDLGPDLDFVASRNALSADEVVTIHCEPTYHVYMIGFAPGFAYLGGMSERISAPRRDSPRQAIPVGSVGIAGKQTGVYPVETPGGWQLIGRTPKRLFRPEGDPASLLEAGDRVRFTPIGRAEYEQLTQEGR